MPHSSTRAPSARRSAGDPAAPVTTLGLGKDIEYFVETLSLLVGSGMSMVEAMSGVGAELRSPTMRTTVQWMREEIEAGAPLSDVMERSHLFPAHVVSLIKIGEESGSLSENLRLISEQQKKERDFREKLLSALMYPVFVLAITLFVGVGIAWFILPKLATVFSQLDVTLPTVTKALIALGEFLAAYGATAVPLFLIALALVFYFIFFFPKTKHLGQRLLFRLPGTSELIRQIEVARFSYLLNTLLKAGLPVTRALQSIADATTFRHYERFYRALMQSVNDGNSFHKSFGKIRQTDRLIPTAVQQMISAGERSGTLPESLATVNEAYEAKLDITTKNLGVILEPILLVIVWVGVVGVAVAVILPIYSLVGDLTP